MTVDRATLAVYEQAAAVYDANRPPRFIDRADDLAGATAGPLLDAGCGTGAYLAALGASVIGLDASMAMLGLARQVSGNQVDVGRGVGNDG